MHNTTRKTLSFQKFKKESEKKGGTRPPLPHKHPPMVQLRANYYVFTTLVTLPTDMCDETRQTGGVLAPASSAFAPLFMLLPRLKTLTRQKKVGKSSSLSTNILETSLFVIHFLGQNCRFVSLSKHSRFPLPWKKNQSENNFSVPIVHHAFEKITFDELFLALEI